MKIAFIYKHFSTIIFKTYGENILIWIELSYLDVHALRTEVGQYITRNIMCSMLLKSQHKFVISWILRHDFQFSIKNSYWNWLDIVPIIKSIIHPRRWGVSSSKQCWAHWIWWGFFYQSSDHKKSLRIWAKLKSLGILTRFLLFIQHKTLAPSWNAENLTNASVKIRAS